MAKRMRGIFRGKCFAAKCRLCGRESEQSIGDDELFYNKVSAALTMAPNSNPLSNVLDRSYMMTLEGAERERYVFSLSERVQQCIRRFEQEQKFGRMKIAR